ncbi:MAG: DUF427 domain-containing protein [Pseudomonadota bacterium]
MPKAIWQGVVIAEASTDAVQLVEGNVYFPPQAVHAKYLKASSHHTVCSWKGIASYYDVVVPGAINANAAWFYPQPKEAAKDVAGFIAFWRGVQVLES